MNFKKTDYPSLLKEIREQLGLSQEDLARRLGVSLATVNRWENGLSKPSKLAKAQFDSLLAKAQFDSFCEKMTGEGKLKLSRRFVIEGKYGP